MITLQTAPRPHASAAFSDRLYALDLSGDRIVSCNSDGTDWQVLLGGCNNPDGIAVDFEAGHIYWTNMGAPPRNDGSIERVNLDGSDRRTIVPAGGTFTPKQIQLEKTSGKLYWCDREGMRVMRSNLDGSKIETLVVSGDGAIDRGDQTNWCVGIAVDSENGHIYWTQKGPDNGSKGRIFRAGIDLPAGEDAANRSDIETLFSGLPEPIDLELDREAGMLYWTDRGDPPHGNTVNRAPLDANGSSPEILFDHLMEGIGLALDLAGGRMFMTDLGGSVYSARLDGSDPRVLVFGQGNLTGIAFARLPQEY